MKTEMTVAKYLSFDNPAATAMRDCKRLLRRYLKSGKARDLIEYEATAEAFHILSTRAKRSNANRVSAMKRLQDAGLLGEFTSRGQNT
jgi:hypothetical protein